MEKARKEIHVVYWTKRHLYTHVRDVHYRICRKAMEHSVLLAGKAAHIHQQPPKNWPVVQSQVYQLLRSPHQSFMLLVSKKFAGVLSSHYCTQSCKVLGVRAGRAQHLNCQFLRMGHGDLTYLGDVVQRWLL